MATMADTTTSPLPERVQQYEAAYAAQFQAHVIERQAPSLDGTLVHNDAYLYRALAASARLLHLGGGHNERPYALIEGLSHRRHALGETCRAAEKGLSEDAIRDAWEQGMAAADAALEAAGGTLPAGGALPLDYRGWRYDPNADAYWCLLLRARLDALQEAHRLQVDGE